VSVFDTRFGWFDTNDRKSMMSAEGALRKAVRSTLVCVAFVGLRREGVSMGRLALSDR